MIWLIYKGQQFNKYDNKKKQSLNKYKSDNNGNRYIFFLLTALFLLSQKDSNYLSDLGKKIKSLTHLVYIFKNC